MIRGYCLYRINKQKKYNLNLYFDHKFFLFRMYVIDSKINFCYFKFFYNRDGIFLIVAQLNPGIIRPKSIFSPRKSKRVIYDLISCLRFQIFFYCKSSNDSVIMLNFFSIIIIIFDKWHPPQFKLISFITMTLLL